MPLIHTIQAREILDSRGNPTIEVDVDLDDGSHGRAAVPSGASTGSREASELRDGDPHRFGGKGVTRAVVNVEGEIDSALHGVDAMSQADVDRRLCELDGTENKARLGANALLGVSMAVARAAADSSLLSLYHYLGGDEAHTLPVPMFNVLNGGVHADNTIDVQEFMIAPVGASSFREAVRMGAETYQALKKLLQEKHQTIAVGDEGGFAPRLASNDAALDVLVEAIERAGFRPGHDVVIALDPASSEFYDAGMYVFKKSDGSRKSSDEMVTLYQQWIERYPIRSLEDGLAEQDWDGWRRLTERLGSRLQLVGDDIFVTNPAIIRQAIDRGVGNAALIKLNQIGTVTETLEAIKTARSAGYGIVISHRSGETADDFIADLAVAANAGQIKTGAPCRGERVAKYNQLMRIEEELGERARFAGATPFVRLSL